MTEQTKVSGHRTKLCQRAQRFWSTDRSLTVLLVLLIGNLFLLPLAQFATWGRVAARTVVACIMISGLIATLRDRRVILLAIVLVLGSLFVGLGNLERPNLYLELFNNLYSMLLLGFLIILIMEQVFRPGPITARRVQGSIAVYLLLGLLWSIWFGIAELLQPGSFKVVSQKGEATLPQLAYFSFTTLSTLGLGDIIPLRALARSLVMLEALVGQLFPVILIARLVTLEIEHQAATRQR